MKRRLSIGISTIGSPKIIFMDEPTTGLDPVNRRGVWHMIQKLKKNRVIILTTHSMEEADVLSDKVAIMAYGKVKVVGSGLHLKNRFGKGYRFNIVTDDTKRVINDLTEKFDTLKLEESDAGSLQFTIALKHQEIVPKILNFLELNKNGLIKEWGLGHATLEEVFLRVAKENEFGFEDGDHDDSKPNDEISEVKDDKDDGIDVDDRPTSYQFRALFRKNFSLQGRQRCTNCCQIISPVLVILIMFILQSTIQGSFPQDEVAITFQTLPIAMNDPFGTDILLLAVFGNRTYLPNSTYGRNLPNDCYKFFWYADLDPNNDLGSSQVAFNENWPQLDYSEYMQNVPKYQCIVTTTNETTRYAVPTFFPMNDTKTLASSLLDLIVELSDISVRTIRFTDLNYETPDGYIIFNEYNNYSGYKLNLTLGLNTIPTIEYHRKNNFTRTGAVSKAAKTGVLENEGWGQMIDQVIRPWINQQLHIRNITKLYNLPNYNTSLNGNFSFGIPNTTDVLDSMRVLQAMAYPIKQSSSFASLEFFGTFLYPIAMSLQLSVYIFILVLEKKTKLREMMKSHGLRARDYYLSNYIFFFFLYTLSIIFFWGIGALAQFRLFSQTHGSVLFIFFLGWGLALVSVAFFISAFLSDPRAATIVGYGIALLGSLISIVVCAGIFGTVRVSSSKILPVSVAAYIWPQMAFVRGIFLMSRACSNSYSCYQSLATITADDELINPLIALYCEAILFFIAFLYFDAVLPNEYGVPKHPLFFMDPILKYCCNRRWVGFRIAPIDDHNSGNTITVDVNDKEDEDVHKIRDDVDNGNYSKSDPLVIRNLRKVYDSGKVAVKNLCLMAKKNTVFGLLGENGAGKTTTISMLTGLFPPTSGTAYVGGYDITSEIDKVHLVLGVCPQFDVLWEDLTCNEHLLFYARLKGVDPAHERLHVTTLLKQVGLYKFRHRLSSQLSGGMKRRLSLAISLVGKSRITFLDEPTTGLDPATRRHIWAIIARAKADRAIILTTHGMDEAETLCNEIGILAHGYLRCVGSAQHLKSVHGEGYLLTVSFEPENGYEVDKFITSTFKVNIDVNVSVNDVSEC
eukprot:TRINITY_DN749_c1_g1_i2.p1 TRINITY_DN749_c1_g1~~TRINITY_DN749_c1_g1_i2.p1  ORF type:complete len:1080 (-),score=261.04 TRINITY_DN749_c1_g1_i2:788-4027(-)